MVLAWENLREVFGMLVVVVFYLTGGFSFHCFTASATVLSGRFLPTVLPYTPSFVTQMRAGTPLPGSSSVSARKELSLPADAWT